MIKRPRTFEEAKVVIQNSYNDDYHNRKLRNMKLRAAFVGAIGMGAAIALGASAGAPAAGLYFAPAVALIDSPFLAVIFSHKSTMKKVENGEYFKGKSEQEIIQIAQEYADEVNEYEAKKGGMSK